MDSFKEALRQLRKGISWSVKDLRNLGLVVAVLVFGVWPLGFVLIFGVPAWATAAAVASAEQAINDATTGISQATNRFNAESPWYKAGSGYIDDLDDWVTQGNGELTNATNNLAEAKTQWNPDEKFRLASAAHQDAKDAAGFVRNITDKLDANLSLRASARQALQSTTATTSLAAGALDGADARMANEAGAYLNKYMHPLTASLTTARTNLTDAQGHITTAQNCLPADEDTRGIGDPTAALEELHRANALIVEVTTLVNYVTGKLAYQATAKQWAQPKTDEAGTAYASAEKYLSDTKVRTGYWLTTSTNTLTSASNELKRAQGALTTLVDEGKVDYKVAYEAALQSLNLSQQATKETDAEVALASSALSVIGQIDGEVKSAQAVIGTASVDILTLDVNHAGATWSSVGDNVNAANNKVDSAFGHKATAESYMSLTVQRFADAKAEADLALADLAEAKRLAGEVSDVKAALETLRTFTWPNAESNAQNIINGESTNIGLYGGYDTSAKSNYDSAVTTLEDARGEARNRYFQNAVDKANSAASLASGTGSRAYSAYVSYQNSLDDDDDTSMTTSGGSSWGDSGGSSDWGDSGGSSDWGDSGGSSDWGDSGGDSDWGGGSDSDW